MYDSRICPPYFLPPHETGSSLLRCLEAKCPRKVHEMWSEAQTRPMTYVVDQSCDHLGTVYYTPLPIRAQFQIPVISISFEVPGITKNSTDWTHFTLALIKLLKGFFKVRCIEPYQYVLSAMSELRCRDRCRLEKGLQNHQRKATPTPVQ